MTPTRKPLRCRNRQCRKEIGILGGKHEHIICPHCELRQRVYTEHKGFRVTIRNNTAAR